MVRVRACCIAHKVVASERRRRSTFTPALTHKHNWIMGKYFAISLLKAGNSLWQLSSIKRRRERLESCNGKDMNYATGVL